MAAGGNSGRLLVVDDSPDTRELLQRNLTSQGYEVVTAPDVASALGVLESVRMDLVITDLKMPGASGLELVRHVCATWPDTLIIMITGYPSMEGAAAAVKAGAEELLVKPFTQDELFAVVRRVMEKCGLQGPVAAVPGTAASPFGLVGLSEGIQKVIRAISQAAATATPTLLTGERGTGKHLVARIIHSAGPRAAAPFVTISGDAIPANTIDRQLFGYVFDRSPEGTEIREGLLTLAQEGTVLLEDVSRLPLAVHQALLAMVEDKEFCPVGSTEPRKARCRLIVATHHDLRVSVEHNSFPEDLFLRLSLHTISLPPLRERGTDIVLLADHFLRQFSVELGTPVRRFLPQALEALVAYPWPGNLDELRDCVMDLALATPTPEIDVAALPDSIRYWLHHTTDLGRPLAALEVDHIRKVLVSVGGNKTRAAAILGINRKTLRDKLKHAEIARSTS